MRIVFSILYYVALLIFSSIYFLFMFVVFLLTFAFDRKRVIINSLSIVYAYSLFKPVPFWKGEVKGLENFDKTRTCVVVANHQSMFDIPVLYALPGIFKWVSKKEVFKMPFFGWALWMNGVYAQTYQKDMPARVCYQVAKLPLGVKVEIETIAVK